MVVRFGRTILAFLRIFYGLFIIGEFKTFRIFILSHENVVYGGFDKIKT